MRPRGRRVLLAAGAAGPVIFNAGYLINGARQQAYSSLRHTISTLSLTRRGWIQDANFMLYGVSTLCFAEGLRRSDAVHALESVLLSTAGLALIVVSQFRSDPILGFPPGEPSVATARGAIHNVASLAVFFAFPAAALSTVRRPIQGWDAFSLASGVLSLAALGAFFVSVTRAEGRGGGSSLSGFFERVPALFIGSWQLAAVVRSWPDTPSICTEINRTR